MYVLYRNFIQIRQVSLGEYLRKMGRRNKPFNKFAQRKRDRKQMEMGPPAPPPPPDERRPKGYMEIIKENGDFEQYYKIQKICPEEEWPEFKKALQRDLPTAFRICGSKTEKETLIEIVKSEFFSEMIQQKLKVDDKEEEEEIKPFPLSWYPGGVAWQMRFSRTDIRRNETLYRLHNFLVSETAAGGVSRQETVSMIPPVVLDVQPHHKVLDMCAAPGSKTAQLIEFLHADEDKIPTGFVLANDVDNARCYMLVHQAKRLNSPAIIITNHDSAFMPTLYVSDDQNPGTTKQLKFDRVLCDVPCSGDGTLRKNPDIWNKWNPGHANNLHGIQYRILRRGCEMLAVGGRLVYSTCSFNPVENEAVVSRLLQEAGEAVRLVDVEHMLPGLKYNKGMTSWQPVSRDMTSYESYNLVPEKWQTTLRPQMFPPTLADAHKYGLEKCIRVLPHHQDTGGFFVAVFEKLATLAWEKKEPATAPDMAPTPDAPKKEPPKKRKRMQGYREDPFIFLSKDNDDVFPSIKQFFDVVDDFDTTCLLTRCAVGKKKNIYFTSPMVKDVVEKNGHIKIINTGVKTFVRCDNKNITCAFRLSQEGLQSIGQYLGGARRVRVLRQDLVVMLHSSSPDAAPEIRMLSEHTQTRVKDMPTGSCILEYVDAENTLRLVLVGWRGKQSLRTYTPTSDTVHYLRLLGADYSQYDKNKFKKDEDPAPPECDGDSFYERGRGSEPDLSDWDAGANGMEVSAPPGEGRGDDAASVTEEMASELDAEEC